MSSPDTSPDGQAYYDYVHGHLKDAHTVFLTKAEFYKLCEYLRFNGIPHYETITPDGELLNYSFYYETVRARLK